MSEPKLISPLLDCFAMGDPISEHNGVRCCPAIDERTNERYIVKIISIPASQTKLDALLLSGAYPNEEAAGKYFKDLADGFVEEADTLKQLSQMEGFLPYENWQIRPMDGKTGYDVYLLGTYKASLQRIFKREPMTHLRAVNLGLDLCAALTVCRRAGYLYVDLKPGNVFRTDQNSFRIGDLGFVRLSSLKYASLPDMYRSDYTAPEITDAFSSLNETMDIYAAGLILYQAYNNGVLPFGAETKPGDILPPPEYADYEMAEIILKACAPNPEDRWQDPMQMGQALVTYMQRNGANDTPIVPSVSLNRETPANTELTPQEQPAEDATAGEHRWKAPTGETQGEAQPPENADTHSSEQEESGLFEASEEESGLFEASEEVTQEIPQEHQDAQLEPVYTEDELGNLSFLDDLNTEDSPPDNEVADISYQEVSHEVSEFLEQVDDIVAHPVPEPAVAPDPIDVPMPEPIVIGEPKDNAVSSDQQPEEADQPEDTAAEDALEEDAEFLEGLEDYDEDPEESGEEMPAKKGKMRKLLPVMIAALFLLALFCAGFWFYKNYYIQPIAGIQVEGKNDTLTVLVDTTTDESLLYVTCTDDYGNRYTADVQEGKAVFQELVPNTHYTVKVQITGFHKLSGDTSAVYNTPVQTTIQQFSAVTGAEDGSALLSFAAQTAGSPESASWKITYSAEGEEALAVTCTGSTATLTGLTIGKEYTITLMPEGTDYVVGENTITFVAQKLVYAKDLHIVSFADSILTAVWDAPEDTAINSWKVHCYLADGTYVETKTVTENKVTFENLDQTQGYVLEVIADGMSVSERASVEANSITVRNLSADVSVPGTIALTWDATAEAEQWIVNYSIVGTDVQMSKTCNENKLTINDAVPGVTYVFQVTTADGNVLCEALSVQTAEAEVFSCNYDNFPVTAKDISARMCRTPAIDNWNRHDVKKSSYTTTFASGERASFVLRFLKVYGLSEDPITTLFVVRDESGKIVTVNSETEAWNDMWKMYYACLDVPSLPTATGTYKLSIYFNAALAVEQEFTIV